MIDELVYPKWPAQILKKDPNLTRRPSSLPTFSILNSPPLFPALPPAPPFGVSGLGLGAAKAAVRRLRLRAGPVDQGCANKCSLQPPSSDSLAWSIWYSTLNHQQNLRRSYLTR